MSPARLDGVAIAWALQIPCRSELRSILLTVAGRANVDHVMRRPMTALCHELCHDSSTVRRCFGYLESVGAIERLTGAGGRGAEQVIRLCVETPPSSVYHAMQAHPFRFDNPGVAARVTIPKPVRLTRAANYRGAARVSELQTDNPGVAARVSISENGTVRGRAHVRALSILKPLGLTNVASNVVSSETPSLNGHVSNLEAYTGGGVEGVAQQPPAPPPTRRPKPDPVKPILDATERTKLHTRWDATLGAADVEDDITQALEHKNARNYGSKGWFLYVNGWLRRDAERRPPANNYPRSNGYSNGHVPSVTPSKYANIGHTYDDEPDAD